MTSQEPQVWVVIAAYNEAPVIASVVADVKRAGYRALVVDDGSTDATGAVAAEAGCIVVRHSLNLGQGAALQTGIEFALSEGADVIVTFDADGQHRAADIAVLIEALARQDADFALGSRFLGTSLNQPLSRRMLLKAATLFTRLTTGLRVTDTHNGLRAMTRRGASSINLRQNRMAHASEILHQIAASGLNYVEAPVRIEYSAYSLAKGQTLGDTLMILVDLFAEAPPMIAQLILTALLLGILLYALTEYRRSPAVGLIAVLAAVGGLYFVWVPSHATHLAEFVSIGRGVDLIIYIWIVISLLLLLNLHLKLRAHMELITVLARELAIASARSHRSTS